MRPWLFVAAALSALLLATLAGAVNTSSASAKVAVAQGTNTVLLKNDTVFGPTDPNTPETVSFILKAQNLDQLESQVGSGMRHFLTVSQFASQYGQSRQNIDALQSYLKHYGITTSVYGDNLDVVANGTAGQFDNALSVKQNDYQKAAVPAHNGHPAQPARRFHGSPNQPLLPRQLASFVLSILGLSNYPSFNDDAIRVPSAQPAAEQDGTLTPADFAKQYNLPHGTGAGSTIGIVTLAALDVPSAQYFWSKILHISTKQNRITLVHVDGGSGAVSDGAGSGETTLDVEQSGALAPQANIIVYDAPNTDPGFLDAFYQAASDNKADTISSSWGEAETYINYAVKGGAETPTYAQSFDEAFLEMAAQGQSSFVSAGDAGAYDDSDELGTTNLDVDSPGDSPWVTTAGGTTLPGTVPLPDANVNIPAERAWGWDWLFPHWADYCFLFSDPSDCTEANVAEYILSAGTGGGYSTINSEPGYQQQVVPNHYNAVEYLTPDGYDNSDFNGLTLPTTWDFNPTPNVQSGRAPNGRAVPDVSADADPYTGYEEYFSFDACGGGACTEDGWGGTSFVAPQLNGSTAVIDANLGHRIGFWNPQVYSFATQHNSPFHTLDSASANNDNLFYTGTPGQLYNPATGLGTPDLTALQNDFAQGGGH